MPDPFKKVTLHIPREDYETFRSRHQGHGDFVGFVRKALKRYNELNDVDLDELIDLAVKDMGSPT